MTSTRYQASAAPRALVHVARRPGFTLMELLIVILIIGLLAALSVAALMGAAEQARATRTRAIINKLDQLIMAKYEGYRTRTLPIRTSMAATPRLAAAARLAALRELQRMELPDRRTDVFHLTTYGMELTATMPQCSLQRTYYRKALAATGGTTSAPAPIANWTPRNQGAECLYLIVSAMHDGDKNALDFFSPAEIGDTDEDGMKEILDGWGNPIHFLRWGPAYTRENGALTEQTAALDGNGRPVAPDPFDPVRADILWRDATAGNEPYALRPLIVSAGRDESLDVAMDLVDRAGEFRYHVNANNPYYVPTPPLLPLGSIGDMDGDGNPQGWLDNISNHYQEPQ